jgi:hypothetical protein
MMKNALKKISKKIIVIIGAFSALLCPGLGSAKVLDDVPDWVPLSGLPVALAHNLFCSKAYGWVYYQQDEDLEGLTEAGVLGGKTPLHWYKEVGGNPRVSIAHEPQGESNAIISVLLRGGKGVEKAVNRFKEIKNSWIKTQKISSSYS